MDRLLWGQTLHDDRVPEWPCPRCGKGHLKLVTQTMKMSKYDNVLDALQLLEFVFERVFGTEKNINAMSKLINKKKGSRHHRK